MVRFLMCYRQLVLGLIATCLAGPAAAVSTEAESLRRQFVSSWIVNVTGEPKTRTLNIRGMEMGADGVWVLDATYGLTDGGQSAVKARLQVAAGVYKLEFTTQPGTLVVAEGTGNGNLNGTFTPRGGSAKPVQLDRISDDELKARVADLVAARTARKAEAQKWLERDKFQVYIPETGFLYQTYPKDGYTYMTGWSHDCAYDFTFKRTRRIPTKYSVDNEGALTLEFDMDKCTNDFKYAFTGLEGQTFSKDGSGKWSLRPLVVELRE